MKRQRGESMKASKKGQGSAPKRKGKRVDDEKVEEERKATGESVAAVVESFVTNCEELPWLRGIVDEQMSWGSIWLPIWDVEYMGKACSEMFSDVWDDDIWNLRSIDHIPNP